MRTGDGIPAADTAQYKPDTLLSIFVRVTKKDWKYRGLMIHAVAANGSSVPDPHPAAAAARGAGVVGERREIQRDTPRQ